MYCSNCGRPASGNFCSGCGHPLAKTDAAPVADTKPAPPPLPSVNTPRNVVAAPLSINSWQEEHCYEMLLHYAEVRKVLSHYAKQAKKPFDIIGLTDKAYKPLVGVSIKDIASIAAPLGDKLGLHRDIEETFESALPPGMMIVCCLAAFYTQGHELDKAFSDDDGSTLQGTIAPGLLAWKGELKVVVLKRGTGCQVNIRINFPGSYYVWGKEKTVLKEYLAQLHELPQACERLSLL
jgi:hypothetical protein